MGRGVGERRLRAKQAGDVMVKLVDLRGQGIVSLFQSLEPSVRVVRDPRDAGLGASRGVEEFLEFFHMFVVVGPGASGFAVGVVDSNRGSRRQGARNRCGRCSCVSAWWRLTFGSTWVCRGSRLCSVGRGVGCTRYFGSEVVLAGRAGGLWSCCTE